MHKRGKVNRPLCSNCIMHLARVSDVNTKWDWRYRRSTKRQIHSQHNESLPLKIITYTFWYTSVYRLGIDRSASTTVCIIWILHSLLNIAGKCHPLRMHVTIENLCVHLGESSNFKLLLLEPTVDGQSVDAFSHMKIYFPGCIQNLSMGLCMLGTCYWCGFAYLKRKPMGGNGGLKYIVTFDVGWLVSTECLPNARRWTLECCWTKQECQPGIRGSVVTHTYLSEWHEDSRELLWTVPLVRWQISYGISI